MKWKITLKEKARCKFAEIEFLCLWRAIPYVKDEPSKIMQQPLGNRQRIRGMFICTVEKFLTVIKD